MNKRANQPFYETTINPFEVQKNSIELKSCLDNIDSRNIRFKFKNTVDPINLAFDTLEATSVEVLARDFIRESITDFISFVSRICR